MEKMFGCVERELQKAILAFGAARRRQSFRPLPTQRMLVMSLCTDVYGVRGFGLNKKRDLLPLASVVCLVIFVVCFVVASIVASEFWFKGLLGAGVLFYWLAVASAAREEKLS